MFEYRMTVVKFGLGFLSAEAIAHKCEAHMSEMAAEGWRLVHADRNSFAIPGHWSFIWERSNHARVTAEFP
ncbi:unnamed protein product [Gemmata massiliana]|uniref:DUF4177 domain-containing protein n=1 Tax=Gemmata massiliana TaxID=1210884 RepID=A0A6P2DL79_9BACT|nr:hypothetical protein [Gemmata massiliana]VTS03842.1 unnamed protein product [Gemmata massiliana]